jgi:hypothetical protein
MAIQLGQVAGVIEEREMLLHSAELSQCSGRCRETVVTGGGKELQMYRLTHGPRPAFDQLLVRWGKPDCERTRSHTADERSPIHGALAVNSRRI